MKINSSYAQTNSPKPTQMYRLGRFWRNAMIRKMGYMMVLLLGSLEGGWLDRKAEGWAWYEEPSTNHPEKPEQQPTISPTEQLAMHRQELENLLAEAILNPSEENTMRYMEAQNKWITQSARFASTWNTILLHNPQLDPTATTFATSQYGRQVQKSEEQEKLYQQIRDLGSRYGLFFFYEGAKKSSQALAKVVEAFVKRHEWSVMGISVDGTLIADVHPSKVDNDIAARMGITVFPALIAVDPKGQQAFPVAFGLQSLDRLEANIKTHLNNTHQEQI